MARWFWWWNESLKRFVNKDETMAVTRAVTAAVLSRPTTRGTNVVHKEKTGEERAGENDERQILAAVGSP